jgi:hypothetical protein
MLIECLLVVCLDMPRPVVHVREPGLESVTILSLPPRPVPKPFSPPKPVTRPPAANRDFWLTMAVLGAAKSADMLSTARAQGRGCVEDNRLFGPHPSNGRLVGVNLGYFAGEIGTAYVLKRVFRKHKWLGEFWRVEPVLQSSQHAWYAARNEGLRCR